MSPIARATLREMRLTLAGTAGIMLILTVWVCAVYPSFRSSFGDLELPAGYEAFVGEAGSLASPAGFLSAEYFSWIPALLAGVAIAIGTRSIGGEESEGTLEILLAQPISRTRVLVEKSVTLAAGILLVAALMIPAFAIGLPLGDLDIALWRVAVALGLLGLLALVYLMLGIWLSALLPSRRLAAVVASGALIAGYFLNTLGAAVPAIDPWRLISPLYWSDASLVLTGDFGWWRLLALIAAPIVLWLLAHDAFCRREVGSGIGAWPRLRVSRRRAARAQGRSGADA